MGPAKMKMGSPEGLPILNIDSANRRVARGYFPEHSDDSRTHSANQLNLRRSRR